MYKHNKGVEQWRSRRFCTLFGRTCAVVQNVMLSSANSVKR